MEAELEVAELSKKPTAYPEGRFIGKLLKKYLVSDLQVEKRQRFRSTGCPLKKLRGSELCEFALANQVEVPDNDST